MAHLQTRRNWLAMAAPMAAILRGQDQQRVPAPGKRPLEFARLQLDSASVTELAAAFRDLRFAGSIPPLLVDAIRRRNSIGSGQLLTKLLPIAQELAYPPITNFRVGCAMLGQSGAIYLGGNIEVPGQSAALCVHAEQCAASLLYNGLERAIRAMAVTAAPCGHCRQFLYELMGKTPFDVYLSPSKPVNFQSLLPLAYGPEELGVNRPALPAEKRTSAKREDWSGFEQAAFDSFQRSYAPYTKALSGVSLAIGDSDEQIFTGPYIENCAFNPSLPPAQAAIASVTASGFDPSSVVRATLVEFAKAKISQVQNTRAVLEGLCPRALLTVKQV